jgi:predicted DNA-binding transcriptional regulator AlpA
MTTPKKPLVVWITGPQLRERWGLANTTFYEKLKKGVIPAPEYPFGPQKPYWRMQDVERFEEAARSTSKKGAAR